MRAIVRTFALAASGVVRATPPEIGRGMPVTAELSKTVIYTPNEDYADPSYRDPAYQCADYSPLSAGEFNIAEYRCRSGKCISIKGHCNGIANCDDSSDEVDCPKPSTVTTTIATTVDEVEGNILDTAMPVEPTQPSRRQPGKKKMDRLSGWRTTTEKETMFEKGQAIGIPSSGDEQKDAECFEQSTSYTPLDKVTGKFVLWKYAANAELCRQRCAKVKNCEHFAYGSDRSCHLVGIGARRIHPVVGFVSGSPRSKSCSNDGDIQRKFGESQHALFAIGDIRLSIFSVLAIAGSVFAVSCSFRRWSPSTDQGCTKGRGCDDRANRDGRRWHHGAAARSGTPLMGFSLARFELRPLPPPSYAPLDSTPDMLQQPMTE